MKINKAKISINELLNQNKFVSVFLEKLFLFFFSVTRLLMKTSRNENNNITVISLHRLGDTIFTIPAMIEIQRYYKENINVVCFPESIYIYKQAISGLKYCSLNREDFSWNGRLAGSIARKKLKALKSEIIFDITGSLVSASLIFNSKAQNIVGINSNLFKGIFDKFVEVRKNPKLMDIYLDAVSPIINISERKLLAQTAVSSNGKIVIHPFAGWKEKEWNLKKFVTLAEKLRQQYPVSILIKGDELSNDIIEEIKHSRIDIIQSISVEMLIQVIRECSLFIGNDSGPLNIANYFGKPTLTIFGSTHPEYTATGDPKQKIIMKKLGCSAGIGEKVCLIGTAIYKCSGTQCMNLLSVEDVYEEIIPLIKTYTN